jgi:hypothetical protein
MPSPKWGSTNKLETIHASVNRQTVIIVWAARNIKKNAYLLCKYDFRWNKHHLLPSQQSELLNERAKCSRIVKFLAWIDLIITSPKVFKTLNFRGSFFFSFKQYQENSTNQKFWVLFPISDITTSFTSTVACSKFLKEWENFDRPRWVTTDPHGKLTTTHHERTIPTARYQHT